MVWDEYRFYLYFPPVKIEEGHYLLRRMPGLRIVPPEILESYCGCFGGLGELNPNYCDLRKTGEKMVLFMTDLEGRPYGFCIFVPRSEGLVKIDVVAVREDVRRRGLGRKLLGYLELAYAQGTLLYVEQATALGRKFFLSCGYERDINLYKLISNDNRILTKMGYGAGKTHVKPAI